MSTNKKHKVSEKELYNLLGQAFLNLDDTNPKNQELMETISNQVMHSPSVGSVLINKAFFAKLTSVIILIATSVFIYFNYFKNKDESIVQNTVTESAVNLNSKLLHETTILQTETDTSNKKTETKPQTVPITSEPSHRQEPTPAPNESPKHLFSVTPFEEIKTVKADDTGYIFPRLTEKEIKETKKQKDKMTNWLLKQSKDKYALIVPKASSSLFTSINDTTAMFYIQNTEVTNLEYRTFLFDLLIHNEKEAFYKAKPHQYLWLNAQGHSNGNIMKDTYFSSKLYNDYPVVNITPEGAELYCKWLSGLSLAKYSKVIARLPYENEWIKAARLKDGAVIYPWPGDSIQNRYGCHLGNFCIQKQSEKLRTNMRCVPKNKNAYGSAEFMLGDSMMTTKVYSYNPNDNGLYCMAGNAAEMVYSNKMKAVITKGGSWNSDFEHCKLYNHEEFETPIKANPMTGFRPIFRLDQTHSFGSIQRDIKETGLQQLTPEEIVSASKEKKKMTDALAKLNKDKYTYIPMGSFPYKKNMFSVQAFYMETTEVTNLEYRTFLADLLIQNRTDDYLIAKPNQQMWITKFPWSLNEPMTNMYFWHPAYDEYPVVNVSRKGALLYCDWLTVEANKVLKDAGKPLINDLRIPVDYEWACAARQYDSTARYANGHKYLRDSKGRYEVNYMCYSKEQCKYDSVMKMYVPKNKEELKETNTQSPKLINDGGFHTVSGRSYAPNKFGLYCMGGNVSEMVNTFDITTKKSSRTGTKGGNWFSCDYFLEIDADDEYPTEIGASPLIGFRPVFTAPKIEK
jgi:formylglycine-generating enzyme required for sulfatase activity